MADPSSPQRPSSQGSRPNSQPRPQSNPQTLRAGAPKHVSFRHDPRVSMATQALQQTLSDDNSESKKSRMRRVSEASKMSANESSPLLGGRGMEEVESRPPTAAGPFSPGFSEYSGVEDHTQETKSSWYLLLLTSALGGLQIAWSVELSNGSPYLLSLGISKSLLAFVWIAGPLSGTLVQPYVGIKSDRCRWKFGKRRPFMIGGACATILSLMALAWTREFMAAICHNIFGVPWESKTINKASIVFAVLMIYILDFSINVIQAGIRAFIVDNAPTHQQDSANAWASRMSGVGNIVGYLFGYVNLPKYLWFFGDTQFKVLCVIASLAMAATLGISCASVKERDPSHDGDPGQEADGVISFFRGLFRSIKKLPTQISRVCQVQFFAWIGWFPFLFYITTYIGEIYANHYLDDHPNTTPDEEGALWERATRQGTFALLIFAFTTFSASIVLPFIVASSFQAPDIDPTTPGYTPGPSTPATPGGGYFNLPKGRFAATPITPHTPGGPPTAGGGFFAKQRSRKPKEDDSEAQTKKPAGLWRWIPKTTEIPWLTLRRAWMLSHIVFAVLMWMTFFVRSTEGATVLVALIGIPWAMTNWAPYALIAAEISKRDAIRRGDIPAPHTVEGEALASGDDAAEGADQAGVVLGIHNVAIAAPQVIATLVSSVIFKLLQKPRGEGQDDSVAWVLRFGGLAALIAAWLTLRIGEEKDEEREEDA
ncbi:hypothetical protein LTR62_007448 [Meristemomyces frigidus]|uniref:Sucrose transporter n=1 Tax=Meristemomyces frigidus TaxID=1508187 RepID=A0AAN7TV68_9PEZI|nr:hypothetical protein LTR62_007448 [Meristemomyces frigidus]